MLIDLELNRKLLALSGYSHTPIENIVRVLAHILIRNGRITLGIEPIIKL